MADLLGETKNFQLVAGLVEYVLQLIIRRRVEVVRGRGGAVAVEALGRAVVELEGDRENDDASVFIELQTASMRLLISVVAAPPFTVPSRQDRRRCSRRRGCWAGGSASRTTGLPPSVRMIATFSIIGVS